MYMYVCVSKHCNGFSGFVCLDEPCRPFCTIAGMLDVYMYMKCVIVKASVSQVSSLRGGGQSETTLKLFGRACC